MPTEDLNRAGAVFPLAVIARILAATGTRAGSLQGDLARVKERPESRTQSREAGQTTAA